MANEIYDSTWWGNTIDTASSIGTSTEMIQGQFNMLTSNQPNLVTNGDFATDSDWGKGTGWGIALGRAVYTGTVNSNLSQNNILTSGIEYRLKYEVINSTLVGGIVKLSGTTSVNQYVLSQEIGIHNLYFKADGSNSSNLDIRIVINTSGQFTLDNVSVKEVRATTVEASKCLADAIHRIGIQDIQN